MTFSIIRRKLFYSVIFSMGAVAALGAAIFFAVQLDWPVSIAFFLAFLAFAHYGDRHHIQALGMIETRFPE